MSPTVNSSKQRPALAHQRPGATSLAIATIISSRRSVSICYHHGGTEDTEKRTHFTAEDPAGVRRSRRITTPSRPLRNLCLRGGEAFLRALCVSVVKSDF